MTYLKRLEEVVKEILINEKLARKDDCYLILKVVSKLYPYEIGKNFNEVMFNAKKKGISFESITRCRRKVQEKNPHLRDEETVKKRKIMQKQYIKYSHDS